MIAEIKISISLLISFFKAVYSFVPTSINLCFRPKAEIQIKNHCIVIEGQDGVESHLSYPCILIGFKKDVEVDVSSVKINDQSFYGMLSRDPNFLNQNQNSKDPHVIKNNNLMRIVSQNWLEITQGTYLFKIKSYQQEVFPLYVKGGMSNFIFNSKKKARVFFPKQKLIFSIKINGSDYQYGISMMAACKVIINNLAHA